jgi:16S rRNA (guanine527-N7)-methyltransferase
MTAQLIFDYFPNLTQQQQDQFIALEALYQDWNLKINVVSRKDIEELYLRHVLHSLAIAKFISFNPGAHILDVGTGGGFPGIPLAILFPETHFTLVDAIGKKIKVVEEVVAGLGLENVTARHQRVEEDKHQYDFVVRRGSSWFRLRKRHSQTPKGRGRQAPIRFCGAYKPYSRAVAAMPTFMRWIKGRIKKVSEHPIKNGVLYLKGGDLSEELQDYRTVQIYSLMDYYKEDFFETKKLVYLPQKFKG